MSNLPVINPDTATGEAAAQLAAAGKALGGTPNMVRAMANSPALLKGYLALNGALAGGALPAGVRERLALTVSEANGCSYCLSAHTYIGEHLLKVPAVELEHARHATSEDPHAAALLTLAATVVRERGAVGSEALGAARRAGATDEEIAEVVGHVALNVLTNYFNVLSDIDVDWPVRVLPGRPAAGDR
ncbi:carboxymuconolactone decarboxylase family protein [Streptomyces sp. NBC_01190]|uniref:carboxymuconolactone decarboxylase family protein n=1 Tax=Streptomyces sp. NBC_01190 TaxID=2903767 RepID=UPI003867A09B|nr:carboxymuconolactone decarboxylase family protein [Streptomyces sp. NBC_01190]